MANLSALLDLTLNGLNRSNTRLYRYCVYLILHTMVILHEISLGSVTICGWVFAVQAVFHVFFKLSVITCN